MADSKSVDGRDPVGSGSKLPWGKLPWGKLPWGKLPWGVAIVLPIVAAVTFVVWHRLTWQAYCLHGPAAAPEESGWLGFVILPSLITLATSFLTRQRTGALLGQVGVALLMTAVMAFVAFIGAISLTGFDCNGT